MFVWISERSDECFSVSESELDGECLVPELLPNTAFRLRLTPLFMVSKRQSISVVWNYSEANPNDF